MEQLLALEMVRVTEAAAIASARFMGRGERDEADRAATEAMRRTMDETDIAGTIVIGEGERDEAPMLYIGEQVGRARTPTASSRRSTSRSTRSRARTSSRTGQGDAITVLAASEKGGLTPRPGHVPREAVRRAGRGGLRRHHAARRRRTATGSPRRSAAGSRTSR